MRTISVLTSDATGNSYTWTPSSALTDADDYFLGIQQGDQGPNYTGRITLSGGSSSTPLTSASASSFLSTSSVAATSDVTNPTVTISAVTSPVGTSVMQSTATPVGGRSSDHSSGRKTKDKIIIGVVIPVSPIALTIAGFLVWSHSRKRKNAGAGAVDKGSAAMRNEVQPYLQEKAELEAQGRNRNELEAREKIHEIGQENRVFEKRGGEDTIHQLEGENALQSQRRMRIERRLELPEV